MKASGEGKLCLFRAMCDADLELNRLQAERIIKKLGLESVQKKSVQKFDMPLIPKQEDFYMFPFRHISACIVGAGGYKATDFSEGTVLKKSTYLLERKPAYLNHNQEVGKEVGVVGETEYVKAYTNENGDAVPAGIEAPFVIDGILNPDLVRKLSSPVSPIDSCSVTTLFKWEASHDFEHDGDFFWHLGEVIEGSMVRRIVQEVICYEESSMVWMGADPFAKKLDGKGQVVNIDRAASYSKNKFAKEPFLAEYDPRAKYFVLDCLDYQKLLHLDKSIEFSKAKPENTDTMEKELLDLLASLFNTTSEKIQKGDFKKADVEKVLSVKTLEELSKMKTNSDNFEKVTGEKVELESKVTKLNGEVTTLTAAKKTAEDQLTAAKPKLESYDAIIGSAKKEVKRVYAIFSKNKPEKSIEDELEAETSLEKLDAKIKMFGGKAVSEYSATCNACKSTDISFRSSQQSETEEQNAEESLNMSSMLHD